MTRERAKELLPIIQAFAEGKTIQVKIGGRWSDLSDQAWTSEDDYRIKAEPRVRYVAKFSNGDLGQLSYTEDEIKANGNTAFKFVKFAEVME